LMGTQLLERGSYLHPQLLIATKSVSTSHLHSKELHARGGA
jgi:hypothetical protein